MNQDLDSRILNYGECFAMKFTRQGKAIYHIQASSSYVLPGADNSFSINVCESSSKKGDEKQHTITIKREGARLYAEPEHLEIDENDVVLWHADNPKVHNFVISGESGQIQFDSARMEQYSVYTHAFGLEGEYHWQDAYGSKVGGVIKVKSPQCLDKKSQAKWLRSMDKGNLITISGNKVEPTELQIVTGQTVMWAIEKSEGISITDSRLLTSNDCGEEPKEKPTKKRKK